MTELTTFMLAVLGLIQGAAEFLPVSSSGHLVIATNLLGWPNAPVGVEIALHLGTLLAVVVYFWSDWLDLLRGRRVGLIWSLLVATGVTAGLAYLSGPYRNAFDHNAILTAYMLIIFGVLMWVVDWRARQLPKRLLGTGATDKPPTFWQSVLLGLMQTIALIPGVSRSGILITTGRGLRMDKEEAARYAFLLSAPTIALTPLAILMDRTGGEAVVINGPVIIGALVAFVSGWLAISFLLSLVKRVSLGWFSLYRVLLAIFILISLR